LIEAFTRGRAFENVLVVSRPITRIELARHREARDPGWNVILRGPKWHVFRDPRGCYVFEYFDPGLVGQVLNGRSWFYKAYGSTEMTLGLFEALGRLGMDRAIAVTMNVRSARLAMQLAARGIPVVFDAWDNWLRLPLARNERGHVRRSYADFAKIAPLWFTNSENNRIEFERQFAVGRCTVVPNGVDPHRFRGSLREPKEFEAIPRPRAFFGGKITHLFDVDLFNDVARRLEQIQFVVAGQIIDRAVWGKIKRAQNVHYLGDIHYEEYPAYVMSSDICMLPYVRDEKSHGGNSIKLYEYAAAGRPTVSTAGNGANEMLGFLSVANSAEEFAEAILRCIERGERVPELAESEFSWDERARTMTEHMATFRAEAAACGALSPPEGEPGTGWHV